MSELEPKNKPVVIENFTINDILGSKDKTEEENQNNLQNFVAYHFGKETDSKEYSFTMFDFPKASFIMATYAYLRVSTIDQNTEKNKLDVLKFVNDKKLGNVEFIEEQISGKSNFKKRQLGALLERMNKGDVLIVPELSRIARSVTQIFEVIEITKQKGITLNHLNKRKIMAGCFAIIC